MHARFDWSLARSFLACLDAGSLLGAARALGSTQPTLGRHIAELEARLGGALFERTGRGLLPTPLAQRLAEPARAMEAAALALERAAASADRALAGSVRITASQVVACHILTRLAVRLRAQQPEIQLELVANNALDDLLRRDADIAVRMLRPTQAGLVARKIGELRLGAYAHRDYLARRGVPRQPLDLLQHEVVGYDRASDILKGFQALLPSATTEIFALRTDDMLTYAQAVRAGFGVGFIAQHLAREDANLVRVLPDLRLPSLPVWLAVHRDIRHSPRVRTVFDFLVRELPNEI